MCEKPTDLNKIENVELLTNFYGVWPCFHDAEVISLHLDRSGEEGPYLEAKVYVFDATSEIDDKGFFILKNKAHVTLRFTKIILDHINDFNHQNVLSSMDIKEINSANPEGMNYNIKMVNCYGGGVSLNCQKIKVLDVSPFVK